MAVIINQQMCGWGAKYCRQPKFYRKITPSPVSGTFVFLFYALFRTLCGASLLWTSDPMFWARQAALMLSLFCWI